MTRQTSKRTRKGTRAVVVAAALAAAAIAAVALFLSRGDERAAENAPATEHADRQSKPAAVVAAEQRAGVVAPRSRPTVAPQDGAERGASAADAFDAATDRWMRPAAAGEITLAEIEAFAELFFAVPKERRDECINRALNLVADENTAVLTGILFDKRADRKTVETVFADVLNRPEEVKKPIMKAIHDDPSHPCRDDVEWIYEVTGERPQNEETLEG